MIEKSPDSELYPPKRSARSAGTHSQTGSTNPTPPNWFPNFSKDPYSVFGPQMPLVPPTPPYHCTSLLELDERHTNGQCI